jgi:hypothetical protein
VESSCKRGNEPSGSIKCWEAVGGLSSSVQLHSLVSLLSSGILNHVVW